AAAIPLMQELPNGALTRTANVIAKYSYGIYLLHIPALAIGLVAFRGSPALIQWSVCALMLVLLPVVAYHAIEEPGIRLGRGVAARLTHARVRGTEREFDAADAPAP
ncbi:MAG TPA: hypothetical protein VNW46_04285, partial [Gemmatimonadaceae bacterium]|nr:hypothetical protein [Gemmatimonadaceae bacterium]